MNPAKLLPRISIALIAVLLAGALLMTTAQAQSSAPDGPIPGVDTAQRDDVVPEDDEGDAPRAEDDGSGARLPGVDTAQRDDVVEEDEEGGTAKPVDDGNGVRLPNVDTAERDDAVPEDEEGDTTRGVDDGSDARLADVDTAERDDVVPEDAEDDTARGVDDGSDARLADVDTAERDDAVEEDEEGDASGTVDDGSGARLPDVDTAERDDAVEEETSEKTDTAPAPTGLRVTSDTEDSVSLSWDALTGAGAYKVEYKESSAITWLHADYVFSGTSETVGGLDCNTEYSFRVRARGDGIPYSYVCLRGPVDERVGDDGRVRDL